MDSQEDKERDNAAKIATAIDEGIKKGEERGLKKGKEEMARNMLKKGLDMSLISEISGLNIEEIQELTKTNQE